MTSEREPSLEDDFINEPYECPECGVGRIDPLDSLCDECGFHDDIDDWEELDEKEGDE